MTRAMAPGSLADLARIEDAGLNASAPPQQRVLDGWLLRFSPGKAKRSRCVNAVAPGRMPVAHKLALCEPVFAQAGLPLTPTFRIRFQQYDTGAFPARGRSFDHVSLAPAPPGTSTVIRAQGFEGDAGDTWGCRIVPGTGLVAVRNERRAGGTTSSMALPMFHWR